MGNSHAKAKHAAESESTVVTNMTTEPNLISSQNSSFDADKIEAIAARKRRLRNQQQLTGKTKTPTNAATAPTPRRRNKSLAVQTRDDDHLKGIHIREEQILVNIAMSDLMAYLQVVANNSGQLPLTKRDDPDLEQSINVLSPEDYARKSAAFCPADVRIIGGVFTKYGPMWDLPTSEEYNACDGAQEPGRSYGGACTNAMLKVLYDAAHSARSGDADDPEMDALFDDDDDDDESAWGKSFKSGFSLDNGFASHNTIAWADLLRKMKDEMREIEYPQVPKLTTSRRLDLSKKFSLVPESFVPATGKKRSLFIGCNYSNVPGAELKASHDDIRSMKDYIVNVHGFPETKELMLTLLDDDLHEAPTFLNIVDALKMLSEESQPGDAVFVQFSGHGGRFLDSLDADNTSYDEAIVPCDYKQAGIIRDTLIFKTLLAPMRYGVTVTILIDSCDTGMIVDLPYTWRPSMETSQPIMNNDFSFVRFLKVVKTLYDSSTFTLLGKTVGTALDRGLQVTESELSDGVDTDIAQESEKQRRNIVMSQESILDALADACRGPNRNVVCHASPIAYDDVMAKREEAPKQSLLEQVMNCTFVSSPDDEFFSDDETDTYKTRTEEESEAAQESFESLTDDEDDFEATKRRISRGGRSRRR
ncbi:hypothetical protein MPSEU_000205500 [Mayamaea pseudoterrestris]|nr:hypothetical protein MPSEU_000205500 [Mayamaea pseudoterrestris]